MPTPTRTVTLDIKSQEILQCLNHLIKLAVYIRIKYYIELKIDTE